jgi:hypothetical protein
MKHRTLLFVAVAALAFAAGLAAQTPSEPAAQTASGRVISSTPTAIVIEDATGTRTTYIVDAQSTVPSGLAAGSRVDIEFHPLEGGKFHTSRVTLLPAETVTQPAPTQAVPATPAPMTDTTSRPMTDTTRPATDTDTTAPADTTTADTGTTEPTRRMPATASPLPLVGLIGLGSLAGGLAARALRRR